MLAAAAFGVVPWRFFGRLLLAFIEIALATALLSGSVIVGHELRDWREWYADPSVTKPWAPTPRPAEPPSIEAATP